VVPVLVVDAVLAGEEEAAVLVLFLRDGDVEEDRLGGVVVLLSMLVAPALVVDVAEAEWIRLLRDGDVEEDRLGGVVSLLPFPLLRLGEASLLDLRLDDDDDGEGGAVFLLILFFDRRLGEAGLLVLRLDDDEGEGGGVVVGVVTAGLFVLVVRAGNIGGPCSFRQMSSSHSLRLLGT
jgi:hypothetical protein